MLLFQLKGKGQLLWEGKKSQKRVILFKNLQTGHHKSEAGLGILRFQMAIWVVWLMQQPPSLASFHSEAEASDENHRKAKHQELSRSDI